MKESEKHDSFLFSVHHSKWVVFNYNDIPEGYYYHVMKSGPIIQRTWHRLEFQNIIDRLPDEKIKVLDLGCGPGTLLSLLGDKKKNIEAVGADLASIQIDFAQRNVATLFPDGRIRFIGIPPSKRFFLPMDNATFDVIILTQVIEHVHPFLAYDMMKEVRRVLRDNGRIILSTPNYRSLWPLLEFLLEKFSPVKYHDQHINKFTPSSFVKFVETCGFDCKLVQSILIFSPFVAHFGKFFPKFFYKLETIFDLGFGSLIVIEANKNQIKMD